MNVIHVTRVSEGAVYGHATRHCDASGCNGLEHYFPEVSAADIAPGDLVDLDTDSLIGLTSCSKGGRS